jgi:hypothetical protein
MNARKWCVVGATAALLTVPLIAIGQQQARAIRQSGTNCFLSVGITSTALVDLFVPGSGNLHDWGIGSTKMAADGGTIYCPVTLDVPRVDGKNPIDKIRILYSTRDNPVSNATPANVVPEIKTCSAFLMDGTGPGTWVGQTDPNLTAGPPTGNLQSDGEIVFDQVTVPLSSATTLRRMLITCTLPRGVLMGGSLSSTYTALIKGYEVQYQVSPLP